MPGILPQGKTQICDNQGAPLAGGFVTFYAQGTTTLLATYEDSGLTIKNANPVTLDAGGRALIWGTGPYTMLVQDQFGNQVWQADTQDISATEADLTAETIRAETAEAANAAAIATETAQRVAGDAARPTFSQLAIPYAFGNSVSGTGATASVSFTAARSGNVLLIANGNCSAGGVTSFALTGNGFTIYGGGSSLGAAGPAVMNYLLAVSVGSAVTLNVTITTANGNVAINASALFIPTS